jgi:hypothetical protein
VESGNGNPVSSEAVYSALHENLSTPIYTYGIAIGLNNIQTPFGFTLAKCNMVKIGQFVMITLYLYSTEDLVLNGSAYVASVPTPNPSTVSTSTAIYMNNCLGFSVNV